MTNNTAKIYSLSLYREHRLFEDLSGKKANIEFELSPSGKTYEELVQMFKEYQNDQQHKES